MSRVNSSATHTVLNLWTGKAGLIDEAKHKSPAKSKATCTTAKTFQKPDGSVSVLSGKLCHCFIRRARSDLRCGTQLRVRENQRATAK